MGYQPLLQLAEGASCCSSDDEGEEGAVDGVRSVSRATPHAPETATPQIRRFPAFPRPAPRSFAALGSGAAPGGASKASATREAAAAAADDDDADITNRFRLRQSIRRNSVKERLKARGKRFTARAPPKAVQEGEGGSSSSSDGGGDDDGGEASVAAVAARQKATAMMSAEVSAT